MRLKPASRTTSLTSEPATGVRRDGSARLRNVTGWATALLTATALVVPVNFVTEEAGPTFNTIGETNGEQLISIEGRQSYPVSGALDMTTVSVAGGPNTRIFAVQTLGTWLASHTMVVPTELMYDPTVTNEQVTTKNASDMSNSQESAQAAAMTYLHEDFTEKLKIADIPGDSPSAKALKPGDELVSIGGQQIKHFEQIADLLAQTKDRPVEVTVKRDGRTLTEKITPTYSEKADKYLLGVAVKKDYDFPFKVKYGLEEVGGPSAGMMFSLGIIDELTPGQMTGGKHFAGTGTIDADGKVGPIGGIAQKMVGAKDAGAEFFLAPADNCQDVVGHVPDGLSVIKVDTLSQAADAVEKLGTGADPAGFPTCN